MPRVILAEDDPELREYIAEVLREKGLEVALVADGGELLDRLSGDRYAVAITDVLMPGVSGPDVLRRRRNAGDTTPFVFLTGAPDEATPAARELGARVVVKPFTRESLVDVVCELAGSS